MDLYKSSLLYVVDISIRVEDEVIAILVVRVISITLSNWFDLAKVC